VDRTLSGRPGLRRPVRSTVAPWTAVSSAPRPLAVIRRTSALPSRSHPPMARFRCSGVVSLLMTVTRVRPSSPPHRVGGGVRADLQGHRQEDASTHPAGHPQSIVDRHRVVDLRGFVRGVMCAHRGVELPLPFQIGTLHTPRPPWKLSPRQTQLPPSACCSPVPTRLMPACC